METMEPNSLSSGNVKLFSGAISEAPVTDGVIAAADSRASTSCKKEEEDGWEKNREILEKKRKMWEKNSERWSREIWENNREIWEKTWRDGRRTWREGRRSWRERRRKMI